jgi:hypothetical protein
MRYVHKIAKTELKNSVTGTHILDQLSYIIRFSRKSLLHEGRWGILHWIRSYPRGHAVLCTEDFNFIVMVVVYVLLCSLRVWWFDDAVAMWRRVMCTGWMTVFRKEEYSRHPSQHTYSSAWMNAAFMTHRPAFSGVLAVALLPLGTSRTASLNWAPWVGVSQRTNTILVDFSVVRVRMWHLKVFIIGRIF